MGCEVIELALCWVWQRIDSHNVVYFRPPYHHDHHTPNDSDSNHPDVAPKRPHVKKPLNAFMLFMKEMRAQVAAECTLKESAAINQILGRRVSEHYVSPI